MPPDFFGSSGKRVPGQFTGEERDCKNVIPAKAGIQEGWLGVAKQFFVYIMASRRNGTLYIGVTSNLIQRVWNHKQGLVEGFTSKYQVGMLVYLEPHETAESAITREKQLKKWERAWKIRLAEHSNPEWRDLYWTISV
jgi:putative endonuclease